MIPLLILALVFVLVALRQFLTFRIQVWQVFLAGAFLSVISGSIPIQDAVRAINPDVMVFLFGMFVVGEALVESGYLYALSFRFFISARATGGLVALILIVFGLFSAVLMNDTLAVIGTPLVLYFAEKDNIPHSLLLLSLCFATTLGSALSPIGNPQNLLIAVGGNVQNPFVTYLKYLAVPTIINLFIAYYVLKFFYRPHFHEKPLSIMAPHPLDKGLARIAKFSLLAVVVLIMAKVVTSFAFKGFDFKLSWIAVAASLPVIILSPKRFKILKRLDWHTLIFFAGMFVLMEAVWMTGFFQSIIGNYSEGFNSRGFTLVLSAALSQLLSNVPFVAMYLPAALHSGADELTLMALSAGSTAAGNLLILGAASNIIIIQNAEKRAGKTVTFFEFAKAGVPLTVINLFVYWLFFKLF